MTQRRKTSARRLRDSASTFAEPVLFRHLASCKQILIAGAGGGFDVYAGLPLAHALWRRGQTVHLANLSFTNLSESDAPRLTPALSVITPETIGPAYFPESALSRFLASEGLPATVYAFSRGGVRQLLVAYQTLAEQLALDAIVATRVLDGAGYVTRGATASPPSQTPCIEFSRGGNGARTSTTIGHVDDQRRACQNSTM